MPRPLPVTAVSDSCPGSPVEHVLAVAEEGEVLVDQPAHQPLGLGGLDGQVGRHLGVEPVGHLDRPGPHLRPVLDRGAHVVEHRDQLGAQPLALGGVGLAVDLQVHPRLADGVVRPVLAALAGGELGGGGVEHLDQGAGDVAADHDDRVHDQVDGAVHPRVTGVEPVGHRVDQERHVLGDDLDHGVPDAGAGAGLPAVAVDGRACAPARRRCRTPAPARAGGATARHRRGRPGRGRAGPRPARAGSSG